MDRAAHLESPLPGLANFASLAANQPKVKACAEAEIDKKDIMAERQLAGTDTKASRLQKEKLVKEAREAVLAKRTEKDARILHECTPAHVGGRVCSICVPRNVAVDVYAVVSVGATRCELDSHHAWATG